MASRRTVIRDPSYLVIEFDYVELPHLFDVNENNAFCKVRQLYIIIDTRKSIKIYWGKSDLK